ncbi:hypothetical protein [Magnetococcus sp. PR-3]|uniref:hypothetical protein n=1 Tax=Magnetococcus sp. PR-3 TaxID=3120355 RepID=UPI002FCE4112
MSTDVLQKTYSEAEAPLAKSRTCTMCGSKEQTDSQTLTFLCDPCRLKASRLRIADPPTPQELAARQLKRSQSRIRRRRR